MAAWRLRRESGGQTGQDRNSGRANHNASRPRLLRHGSSVTAADRRWPEVRPSVTVLTQPGFQPQPDRTNAETWAKILLRQVGSDGIGGVAVQAVPGVVVPAGGAGIFVAGVVLHVAQRGAGVQGEGDGRMAQ
jgi:hypothetical protein